MLADAVLAARFLRGLPAFLRHPVSLDEARAIVEERLRQRERDFLSLVRRTIFADTTSPYRQLLDIAGCEYRDLESVVRRDGLESALHHLHRAGVYLTVDEFKGRRPAVRGGATVLVDSRRLRNVLSGRHVPTQSSGSRGGGTPLIYDLASIRDRAVNTYLTLAARGGADWLKAVWGIPGGSAAVLVRFSAFGRPAVRWFVQVNPAARGLDARYRWSGRALRWGSVLAGVPLPRPEHVPLSRAVEVVRWMAEVRRAGQTPHLWTFPSTAVRLCEAARDARVDIAGARLTVTGEPVTAARLAAIRRAGAEAVPDYGSSEAGGFLSYGCLAPDQPDDVHLFHDLHALIQPGAGQSRADLPAEALLVTSLRATSPFVLFNVSMGDQALVAERRCGCPLERLGWRTHLSRIRSFEKLTAGGMTFLDRDVIRVLDETLPGRFGGGPTDFQLVEEEADDGSPRLSLVIDPAVGALDPAVVVDAFLAEIGAGTAAEHVMALQWRHAGFLRVVWRVPQRTAAGKILHIHRESGPPGPHERKRPRGGRRRHRP